MVRKSGSGAYEFDSISEFERARSFLKTRNIDCNSRGSVYLKPLWNDSNKYLEETLDEILGIKEE